MRKVTQEIAEAFLRGSKKSIGNTMTDGNAVFLHGNKIAERRETGLHLTLAGWNTSTTRERLNGIAQILNISARYNQRDFEPYLNDKLIEDPREWHCFREVVQDV